MASQISDTLKGVRIKLVRAHRHIEELREILEPLVDIDQQLIARGTSQGPNELVFCITRVPEIDPALSAAVGDVLYNFRSALDHLAHQLVLLDGQQPTTDTYFPIYDEPTNRKGRPRTELVRPSVRRQDIRDALLAAQPYSIHQGAGALLRAIRDLSNIDKHRLLLVMVCALDFASGAIWWGKNIGDPDPTWKFSTEPLFDGDPIGWFDFGDVDPPPGFKPNISIAVKLDEESPGDLARRLPVVDLLMSIGHAIEQIINDHFIDLFEEEWFAFGLPGGRLAANDLARFFGNPRIPPLS